MSDEVKESGAKSSSGCEDVTIVMLFLVFLSLAAVAGIASLLGYDVDRLRGGAETVATARSQREAAPASQQEGASAGDAWRTVGGFLCLACIGVPVAFVLWRQYFRPSPDPFIRGRRLITPPEPADRGLPFGGTTISERAATTHFAVIGAPGRGKTLTINMLMWQLLATVGKGTNRRAFVFDYKRELYSVITGGMRLDCPVHIMNPLDARAVGWAIAEDVTDPIVAEQIAYILVPDESKEPFWSLMARKIIAATITLLDLIVPGQWEVRDLLLIVTDQKILIPFLKSHPETDGILDNIKDEKTWENVMAEVQAYMGRLRPIAAAWHRCKTKISFSKWVKDPDGSILLASMLPTAQKPLETVYQMQFHALTDNVLSQPDVRHDDPAQSRIFAFFDEVKEAGKLEIDRFATQGRSKGACLVMGLQDLPGFERVYEKKALEVLAQIAQKVVLGVEDAKTAEWASKLVGQYETLETTWSGNKDGQSWQQRVARYDAVLPSEILQLPRTGPETGITGYYLSPDLPGAFKSTIPWEEVLRLLPPKDTSVPDFVPRPKSDLFLEPFTPADMVRLGLHKLNLGGPLPRLKIATRNTP